MIVQRDIQGVTAHVYTHLNLHALGPPQRYLPRARLTHASTRTCVQARTHAHTHTFPWSKHTPTTEVSATRTHTTPHRHTQPWPRAARPATGTHNRSPPQGPRTGEAWWHPAMCWTGAQPSSFTPAQPTGPNTRHGTEGIRHTGSPSLTPSGHLHTSHPPHSPSPPPPPSSPQRPADEPNAHLPAPGGAPPIP